MRMNKETAIEAQKAIDTLMRTCNIMGVDEDLSEMIADSLAKEHRTIQQTFVKIAHDALVQYGERHQNYYDDRNKMSVEFCRNIKAMGTHFPFV